MFVTGYMVDAQNYGGEHRNNDFMERKLNSNVDNKNFK